MVSMSTESDVWGDKILQSPMLLQNDTAWLDIAPDRVLLYFRGVHAVVIVPAAGAGVRMGVPDPKQFMELAGRPILSHTLERLERCSEVEGIIVVAPQSSQGRMKELIEEYGFMKVIDVVPGGEQRQDSVRLGLGAVPDEFDLVAVHDGVRPLITPELITRIFREASVNGAAIPVVRPKDTVIIMNDDRDFHVPRREKVRCVQTPQAFSRDLLERAFAKATEDGFYGTDEASLVERLGERIYLVEGDDNNIKITTPGDVALAEVLLAQTSSDT